MPFCLGCAALSFPRLVLIAVYLWSDYLERAIESQLLILGGFLLLPLTTLVYAWIIDRNGSVEGLYVVALILAVLIDVGALGTRRKQKD